jgi:membrane protein DedA with SNARE-associated domain
VGVESSGVPVPGETALIASAVLASQGHLEIELVIVVAAAAAIVGDNIGYFLGSRLGRRFFERPGWFHERRLAALTAGDALFNNHGGKAVFLGRWVAVLRIWAAWLAGMSDMPWRSFLLWNALGGIAWALCFGLLGYFGGEAAAHVVARIGVGAAIAIAVGFVVGFGAVRLRRRARARQGDG